MTNALGQASAKAGQAAEGVGRLEQGSRTLVAALGRLAAGAQQLRAGASRLQNGARHLVTGIRKLESGGGALTGGLDRLRSGGNALAAGAGRLSNGADRLASGLSGGSSQVMRRISTLPSEARCSREPEGPTTAIVVATAPIPGSSTPSFPEGAWICVGCFMAF